MGRKTTAGLLFILIAAAMATPACRSAGKKVQDPGSYFSVSGEVTSRSLGIYSGSIRVGDYRFEKAAGRWSNTGEGPAVRVAEKLEMRLSFMGESIKLATSQRAYFKSDLTLLGSVSTVDFGGGRWNTKWLLMGDGSYLKEELMGKSARSKRVNVPEGAVTMESLSLYISGLGFPDEGYREVQLFSLTLGRKIPVRIHYMGKEDGDRKFSISMWGMEEDMWIDPAGMVVKETMPWGLRADSTGKDDTYGALSLEKIFTTTAVPAIDIPPGLADRGSALLKVEGLPAKLPSGQWQEIEPGESLVTVRLEKPVVPSIAQRLRSRQPQQEEGFGLNLDSERIQELAGSIVSGIEDPWDRSEAIGRWVYEHLGKSMREGFSALEALEAGEGECQSHSLLTLALLRSAGIESHFAYGVVYMPDRGMYLFHTWVEVNVGAWIPMDPTLGRFPSGVDHLTLATGEYMDQFKLFPFIQGDGKWRISYAGPVD